MLSPMWDDLSPLESAITNAIWGDDNEDEGNNILVEKMRRHIFGERCKILLAISNEDCARVDLGLSISVTF